MTTATGKVGRCRWCDVPVVSCGQGQWVHTDRAYACQDRAGRAVRGRAGTPPSATPSRSAGGLMEQHLVEVPLVVHPAQPERDWCSGCKVIGLANRIPCEPRIEALRLLKLCQEQRAAREAM